MSAPAAERALPLVYAEPDALVTAGELLPVGSVLEVEVARRIAAGGMTRSGHGLTRQRGQRWVHGDGWSALVERRRARLARRYAWTVVALDLPGSEPAS